MTGIIQMSTNGAVESPGVSWQAMMTSLRERDDPVWGRVVVAPFNWPTDLTVKFVINLWLTPGVVDDLLENHSRNIRKLDELQARKYAGELAAKEFSFHSTICVSSRGRNIVDGQTRLRAWQIYGEAGPMPFVFGVERDTDIDVGRPRRAAQILQAHGERSAESLAAVLRMILLYERGQLALHLTKAESPKPREVVEALDRHPEVRTYLHRDSLPLRAILSPKTAAAMYYLCTQKDPALAQRFVDGLTGVATYPADDPVSILRTQLVNEKAKKQSSAWQLGLCILAWNAWRSARPMKRKKFTLKLVGPEREAFPVIL